MFRNTGLYFTLFIILNPILVAAQAGVTEQEAADIMERIRLRGADQQAVDTLENTSSVGTKSIARPGQEPFEFRRWTWWSRPDKWRVQLRDEYFRVSFIAVNGNEGWILDPAAGIKTVQPLPEDRILAITQNFGFMAHLDEPGGENLEMRYVGKAEADGVRCHHVVVAQSNGGEIHRYFSTDTYVQIQQVVFDPAGKEVARTTWRKFKDVGGILWPHFNRLVKADGTVQTITIDEVQVNTDIPERAFSPAVELK